MEALDLEKLVEVVHGSRLARIWWEFSMPGSAVAFGN